MLTLSNHTLSLIRNKIISKKNYKSNLFTLISEERRFNELKEY